MKCKRSEESILVDLLNETFSSKDSNLSCKLKSQQQLQENKEKIIALLGGFSTMVELCLTNPKAKTILDDKKLNELKQIVTISIKTDTESSSATNCNNNTMNKNNSKQKTQNNVCNINTSNININRSNIYHLAESKQQY